MKKANFIYSDEKSKNTIYGTVSLKDDSKITVSIINPSYYAKSTRNRAKLFAIKIAKEGFNSSAISGLREEKINSPVLIEILRKETQSLKEQYITKTKEYAKRHFKYMEEQINLPIEKWYNKFSIKYTMVDRGTPSKPSISLEPDRTEYHRKSLYKMRNQREQFKTIVSNGFEKYEAKEVLYAEKHYEDSIRKLAFRIEQKGLDISKLKVVTSHIGINIDTILTDGSLTVKAFTIIAEGEIQRPHYRYLIK